MAPGPITWLEIEAYLRGSLDDLTAWERRLIRRIDTAVRNVWAGQAPAAPGKDATNPTAEADINDRGAVRGLLFGIRDRMAARLSKKK